MPGIGLKTGRQCNLCSFTIICFLEVSLLSGSAVAFCSSLQKNPSLWVFAKSYFIYTKVFFFLYFLFFFSKEDIFPLEAHRTRKGNFSHPAVFGFGGSGQLPMLAYDVPKQARLPGCSYLSRCSLLHDGKDRSEV